MCLFVLISCGSTETSVSFLCNNHELEIYVDNNYVGQGLVSYTAPKGVQEVEVTCKKNGLPVYSKNYYIKGHNRQLFDLKVPNNVYYSNDRKKLSK